MMKSIIALSVLALCCGCSTVRENSNAKALGTFIVAAESAMQTWAQYAALKNPPDKHQIAVQEAYDKYRIAMTGFTNLLKLYQENEVEYGDLQASRELADRASDELLTLITALQ